MLTYSKFDCNDYNYAAVMSQELDEFLLDSNIDLLNLGMSEIYQISRNISGLDDGSYNYNRVRSACNLANNYNFVSYLSNLDDRITDFYFKDPEFCDCLVRYYVTLDIIEERIKENAL